MGFWFAKALYTKLALLGGVLPLPFASDRWIETMPKIVAKQMAENPNVSYKAFVEGTVLPNVPLFANLTALGEAVAGTLLVLGLFNGVGAVTALLLDAQLRHGQLAHLASQPGISLDAGWRHDRDPVGGAGRHDVGARRVAGQPEAGMVGQQATLELNVQYGPRLMWLGPPAPSHLAEGVRVRVEDAEHPVRLPALPPQEHDAAVGPEKFG